MNKSTTGKCGRSHDFEITERVKLQICAEKFGLTNTPHYNDPVRSEGDF